METNDFFTTIKSNKPFSSIVRQDKVITREEFDSLYKSDEYEIYNLNQLRNFAYDVNKHKNQLMKSEEYTTAEEMMENAQREFSLIKGVNVLTFDGIIPMFVRSKQDFEKSKQGTPSELEKGFKVGHIVRIPKDLTTDPNNRQGQMGTISDIQPTHVAVKFRDGGIGKYQHDAIEIGLKGSDFKNSKIEKGEDSPPAGFRKMSSSDYMGWGGAEEGSHIHEHSPSADSETTIIHHPNTKEFGGEHKPVVSFNHYHEDGGQGVEAHFTGKHAAKYALDNKEKISMDMRKVHQGKMTQKQFKSEHAPDGIWGVGD